jgi:cyclic dehypoxanthinyl futalosine synthase
MSECRFCAFFCKKDSDQGYIITQDELKQKIDETIELGGTQILLQGGMHPDLGIDYYTDLLKFIKKETGIHVHGFSPPEIHFIAEKEKTAVAEVLLELKKAGLDSIPGGGAEILVDEIRSRVSPAKCTASQWLHVMKEAHKMGIRSSSTMMFGHIETPKHIVQHMDVLRNLQDETGGFTAFIPWTFQPDNTRINAVKKTAAEYLRVLAVSRIFLDNIQNLQASWVTQGDKIAQTALAFGANDFGSTMIEENVVAAAGVHYMLPKEEIIRLIECAGYTAKQRDCYYNIVKEFHDDRS